MAYIEVVVPHKLAQQEALRRIQGLLAKVKEDYGDNVANLQERWEGNKGIFSFDAMGYSTSGVLAVGKTIVLLTGDIKMNFLEEAAAAISGKLDALKAKIENRARDLLA